MATRRERDECAMLYHLMKRFIKRQNMCFHGAKDRFHSVNVIKGAEMIYSLTPKEPALTWGKGRKLFPNEVKWALKIFYFI